MKFMYTILFEFFFAKLVTLTSGILSFHFFFKVCMGSFFCICGRGLVGISLSLSLSLSQLHTRAPNCDFHCTDTYQ